jgi:uncharacterized peroxidase-related enzyme
LLQLPVLTADTAPEQSKPVIARAAKTFGFVPNLIGVLASAPAAAEAYVTLNGIFASGSLSEAERQVVLITVSRENSCDYCLAAHTAVAAMVKVPTGIVEALKSGQTLPDAKLDVLHRTALALVKKSGRLDRSDVDAFLAAGYSPAQLLEIIVGIALKTISNYTNHLADTPLDTAFKTFAWTPGRPTDGICAACAGH